MFDTFLRELSIENLALIDEISLPFEDGLNVITGPTGSGKTMLIEALRLALGERADYELLPDEGNARIDATVEVDDRLEDLFEQEDGTALELRRKLKQDRSSPAHLNGERVRLKTLRERRTRLIDFHGQHENQAVFEPDFARRVLDRFGEYRDVLEEYRDLYEEFSELETELQRLQGSDSELEQRVEFLSYQISELEEFEPDEGEWEDLEDRRLRLESTEEIEETLQSSLEILEGDPSLTGRLDRLKGNLEKLQEFETDLGDWHEEVQGAGVMLEELRRELRELHNSLSRSDREYEELMQRRSRWLELSRKHDVPPEQLYDRYRAMKDEITQLENREERRREITEELESLESDLYDLGDELHEHRLEAADRLGEAVRKRLEKLNLEKAGFEIELRRSELGSAGYDEVRWLFASHESQSLGPLSARVSGGEISRVLLAIKSALAEADETAILVFDEIDTGISGEEASRVGDVLAELAEYHQVICITHLPLVACRADHHIQVAREDRPEGVSVTVSVLEDEERVDELSRLLSGDEVSDVSREQARELLEKNG
jgi:DNA repair protein RecN (Recombination protein N)